MGLCQGRSWDAEQAWGCTRADPGMQSKEAELAGAQQPSPGSGMSRASLAIPHPWGCCPCFPASVRIWEQMAALHSNCASVSGASNFYSFFFFFNYFFLKFFFLFSALLPPQPVELCYDPSLIGFFGSIISVKDGYVIIFFFFLP